EGGEDQETDDDRHRAATAAGCDHAPEITPGEPDLVAREPADGSGLAHAAALVSSVISRKMSSRLDSPRPALLRSSARVPSAISRPLAMTPMRSAIRSATSRMWVV